VDRRNFELLNNIENVSVIEKMVDDLNVVKTYSMFVTENCSSYD